MKLVTALCLTAVLLCSFSSTGVIIRCQAFEDDGSSIHSTLPDLGPIMTSSAKTGVAVAFAFSGIFTLLVTVEAIPMVLQWVRKRQQGGPAPSAPGTQGE